MSGDNVSDNKKHEYAYVAGLGFGVMSGLFALINVLDDSSGPGTAGLRSDDSLNYLITSAFFTMIMILLHVMWNIVFYWGLEPPRQGSRILAPMLVVLSHFLVSELTLLEASSKYTIALPVAAVNLIVMTCLALRSTG